MKTNIPSLEELEAEHPAMKRLTRDELARYVYVLARAEAINEFSLVLAQITGVDAGAVLQ